MNRKDALTWRDALAAYHAARHRYTPDTPEPILVWRFADAPEELQRLSQHGGDEDWLAVVPPPGDVPAWMDTGTSFGVFRVSERELPGGYVVVIGAHA
ncbi:MAG: hypothetical protein KatS3mg015_2522 [Fimbriimonadales bacterium]|nr:MAG: hypothetical protein KatS3mg015_2522 [Fimbriimonadales bacterium]